MHTPPQSGGVMLIVPRGARHRCLAAGGGLMFPAAAALGTKYSRQRRDCPLQIFFGGGGRRERSGGAHQKSKIRCKLDYSG